MKKPRNYLGELYVRLPLPKRAKKHTDKAIKEGRPAKGRQIIGDRLSRIMWGKKGRKRR